MEPTLLYNGVHLQRKKRFTRSRTHSANPARHSLNSTVEINWPQSLHHEEMSPTQRIKQRQSQQIRQVRQKHNSFVGSYLATNLNLVDSRTIHFKDSMDMEVEKNQKTNMSLQHSQRYPPETNPQGSLVLPKVINLIAQLQREESSSKRSHIYSDLINQRSNSYFSRMLRDKLKKYDFIDKASDLPDS